MKSPLIPILNSSLYTLFVKSIILDVIVEFSWLRSNVYRFLTGLCLLVLFPTTFSAQDSLLTELLKPQSYPLQLTGGNFSGPGHDFLRKEGENAQFFLIGENHGIAELPLFTSALFRDFKNLGYKYFATETGPFEADFLEKTASQADWEQQFDAFFKRFPFSIPFYNLKEECALLQAVLADANSQMPLIWGIDQEFAAAPRMIFEHLKKEAKTEESRNLAAEYFEKAQTGFQEALKTKNPGSSFMGFIRPDDFVKLKAAFAAQPKALELLTELEKSIEIYQLWFTSQGYESNRKRAEMMKQYFWNYYKQAKQLEATPKVIFKFGANHMFRGANALNVHDIGNFVSELASQENTGSFHLYVLGQKGTQNRFSPFSPESDKKKAVEASEYLEDIDFSVLFESATADNWLILDLRPLRQELFRKRLKGLKPKMEKLIWSYDAILVMPEVHASTVWE